MLLNIIKLAQNTLIYATHAEVLISELMLIILMLDHPPHVLTSLLAIHIYLLEVVVVVEGVASGVLEVP